MKILSISLFYLAIILALSLGLLYVLLRKRVYTKTSVIDIHKLLHRYIYRTYVYLIFQINPDKKNIQPHRIKSIFEETFHVSKMSEALAHFVRCDEVVTALKQHSEQENQNAFLLPDIFVKRSDNNYYQKLLEGASRVVYDKNVFENMSNSQAKHHLRYYF